MYFNLASICSDLLIAIILLGAGEMGEQEEEYRAHALSLQSNLSSLICKTGLRTLCTFFLRIHCDVVSEVPEND